MCSEAGVKLIYLPPYSLDLNLIEGFFAELKAFIRRHWQSYSLKTTKIKVLRIFLNGVLMLLAQEPKAPRVTSDTQVLL